MCHVGTSAFQNRRLQKTLEEENEPEKEQPDVMGRIRKPNDRPRLKMKDWQNTYQEDDSSEKARVAIRMAAKEDPREREFWR